MQEMLEKRETWVQSLGQEDPLDKEVATHSSVLPGRTLGHRSPAGYSPRGGEESEATERTQTLHVPG